MERNITLEIKFGYVDEKGRVIVHVRKDTVRAQNFTQALADMQYGIRKEYEEKGVDKIAFIETRFMSINKLDEGGQYGTGTNFDSGFKLPVPEM